MSPAPPAPDPLPVTGRTRLTRLPDRQITDRQALHDVLDAGLVAHVALVRDGTPVVLPVAYARDGDSVLLHGSSGGGLLRLAAAGTPLAIGVTLLDGLVFARTVADSSMNYRSVMIVGRAEVLDGDAKVEGLRIVSEHLMPGRWDEVRPTTRRELAATLVLRVPLTEVSLKQRAGDPSSTPDDQDDATWSGVVPIAQHAGVPVAAAGCTAPVPPSVQRLAR